MSSPVGPIEPPTSTGRSASSAASRATLAAARFSSATRPCALCSFSRARLPPKLLVRMMSEPASTKPRCTARTASGRSTFHSSGLSPVVSPCWNRPVPMPPSPSSTPRSARISANLVIVTPSAAPAGAAGCRPGS